MYNPDIYFDEADYIQTSTGSVVNRKAIIHRPEQVFFNYYINICNDQNS